MKNQPSALPIGPKDAGISAPDAAVDNQPPAFSQHSNRSAFSLVEVLVVMALLSLIVLVLMTVFNSTQSAFRAGVTQTDVLEGSRAAMDLLVSDLKLMTPSGGNNNNALFQTHYAPNQNGVGFYANSNLYVTQPLIQGLPGGVQSRTNVLQNFFILSRANLGGRDSWIGTGYVVNATNASPLFPLYRFSTNIAASLDPSIMFNNFMGAILLNSANNNSFTNPGWSHLIDGVVDFRVRAFDVHGFQMTNIFQFNNSTLGTTYTNVLFLQPQWNQAGFYFFSNTIPAAVELQVGVLEDRPLQRAESLPFQSAAQTNYLAQQAGRVHIFRQRVTIPNVDPTVYQ